MKTLATFAFLAFALTGLLTVSVIPGTFADTENPGRDQGTKTTNGCEKGTAKNNPNCGTSPPTGSDTDGDGIPDSDDACPNHPVERYVKGLPDHDKDGIPDHRDRTPCPV